jgi:hypothetical protein
VGSTTYDEDGVEQLRLLGLGGTGIHVDLFGRSDPDQHPISAITGLTAQIADFESRITNLETLTVNHETRITALEALHPVAFDDLSDVDLTGAADNDLLYRSGGNWIDTAGVLEWDGSQLTINDYTFPAADGIDRQILVTDGLGVLTFEDQGTTAGLLSAEYRFSTSIVAADPGAGRFRFDTAANATVTEIFIDIITDNGADITNLLAQIAIGDRLYFQNRTDAAKFVAFDVIVDAVDNTGWFTIGVNAIAEGTFLGNNDRCIFIWSIDGASSPQRLEYEAMSTRSLVNSDFTIGSTIAEGVQAVSAGAGALVFSPTAIQDDHPGIWGLRTGTTAAGRVFIIGRVGSYNIGVGGITRVGTWVLTPSTLSDAVQEYVLRAGFFSISLPNTIDFGVGFEYQFDQNGGRWQGITDATAESSVDTGVTVVVDTWYFLELEINADATSVEFFIDQVSVGTLAVAANIPQGTGFNNFYNAHIMKLAGTTSRDFFIDAYYVYQEISR